MMTSLANGDRGGRLAPWLGGILLALPVLIAKYPPMDDLPLHEASVGLLRHWGDRLFAPPSIYFLNLGHANQLFSLMVLVLAYAVPIAWASKIVVATAILALSVAAGHFADHVGASRWTALLVAPIGLGWLFFWGLVQNIVGLAVLLALLPAIDRFAARPSWRGVAGMCGAMVLMHFAHQAMQLVACMALVMCSVGFPLRAKPFALRALPIAFCGALVYAASTYAWRFAGPISKGRPAFQWKPVSHKLATVPGVLFAGYEPYIRNLIMALAVVPLVLIATERIHAREGGDRSLTARIHGLRFELLALVLFGLYLGAPAAIKSTTLVYHRFLPPAWAIFAVAIGSNTRAIARLPRALCAVLPVASLLVAWPSFADSDQVYSDLEALMPLIRPGCAVMALGLEHRSNRLWEPMVMMGHVVAVRGGRGLFDYTQSPVSPVSQRPTKQWAEPLARMENAPYELRPDWDFTRFRYFLLSTPQTTIGAAVTLAIRNDAILLGSKGDIYLFESRLPVAPIDSDDAPVPMSDPPTLRQMLAIAARELEQIEHGGSIARDAPQ